MPVLSPTSRRQPKRTLAHGSNAPDDYLVRRAAGGCLNAYAQLIDRHGPLAYRVALRLLGNHQDAEDVTREALAAARQRLSGFRGDMSYPIWLLQIVIQRALGPISRPARETACGARADRVAAVVAALPPPQRTAIVLHHFEGLSHDEVARVTSRPVPAVREDLLRGRRGIARTLQDQQ